MDGTFGAIRQKGRSRFHKMSDETIEQVQEMLKEGIAEVQHTTGDFLSQDYLAKELISDIEKTEHSKIKRKDKNRIISEIKKAEKILDRKSKEIKEITSRIISDSSLANRKMSELALIREEIGKWHEQLETGDITGLKKDVSNLKVNPLEQILKRTASGRVVEKERGHLYRIFSKDEEVPQKEQDNLNSKIVTRARFLLTENCSTFAFEEKDVVESRISDLVRIAYLEHGDDLISEHGIENLFIVRPGSFVKDQYVIHLVLEDTEMVILDVSIDKEKRIVTLGVL